MQLAGLPLVSSGSAASLACPTLPLHRLRHTVAVILVAEGKRLAAQHRLGHRDLSTTLRHYGWAQAPDDAQVAELLDGVLNGTRVTERW